MKNPEAERIAKLFQDLAENKNLLRDRLLIKISGGKAEFVLLNDTIAEVMDLTAAREKQRARKLKEESASN